MSSIASSSSQPSWTNVQSIKQYDENHNFIQEREDDDGSDFLSQPYSTLDEPVSETIMRDLKSVGNKLKAVLLAFDKKDVTEYVKVSIDEDVVPTENQKHVISTLKDWDLWGPLLVGLTLSILLSFRAPSQQAATVFAVVFSSMWLGSGIVTINAQLLGGSISFFQSVCVLGYCVSPFVVSALIILSLHKTFIGKFWIDIIWVMLAFVWSTRASIIFIGQYIAKERRFLAVYPVLFYYTFLGWLVLLF